MEVFTRINPDHVALPLQDYNFWNWRKTGKKSTATIQVDSTMLQSIMLKSIKLSMTGFLNLIYILGQIQIIDNYSRHPTSAWYFLYQYN